MNRTLTTVACVAFAGALLSEPALAWRSHASSRSRASGPHASVSGGFSMSGSTSGGTSISVTAHSSGGGRVKIRAYPPPVSIDQPCPTACTVTVP